MTVATRRSRKAAAAKSDPSVGSFPLPYTTKWHRDNGRGTRRDKAIKQQLLTPREEQAIVDFVLRADRNGFPAKVKDLHHYATVFLRGRAPRRKRGASPKVHSHVPSKDWPQAFCKHHPELKVVRLRALDWRRHEKSIYNKVVKWFDIMRAQLEEADVLQENVYNMDETGVLLSVLGSSKYLVSAEMPKTHRGTDTKRTLVTAVECISADGRTLPPLIIFPGVDLRSNWVCHEAPDWQFTCSKKGYMNSEINLEWLQKVFEPSTRERANSRPRILISDGFETHESFDVLKFCLENNIVPCRLPSHTSHKLQPCDVSVFGPLKIAYREKVEHLERRGANAVNKEHFVLLYRRARDAALTARNIRSGWSKAGLFPFNPSRVLEGMSAPIEGPAAQPPPLGAPQMQEPLSSQTLTTPTTTEGVHDLHRIIEEKLGANSTTRDPCLEKLLHATEKAFADRSLFLDENESLLKQNDERRVRQNAKSTVISQGDAKIISSGDIVEMQRRQAAKADAKRAKADARKAKVDAKKARSDAKKAKAGAKTAEADARKSQVPAKRQRKVEPVVPNHEVNVGAHRMVVDYLAPCPNRAPVAQMWWMPLAILGGVVMRDWRTGLHGP
jgi:hypothetical protein